MEHVGFFWGEGLLLFFGFCDAKDWTRASYMLGKFYHLDIPLAWLL
jgi:hypothetical protein